MAERNHEAEVTIKHGRIHDFRNSILAYTMAVFVMMMTYFVFWGGIYTVVTSIERRYSFASWQSGLIIGASEYGRIVALLPMSYIGGRSHVPRITAICGLSCACVMILITLPHFVLKPMQGSTDISNNTADRGDSFAEYMCMAGGPHNDTDIVTIVTEIDERQTYLSNTAFGMFVAAMIALGVCATPFTNITIAYIDINATSERAPLYVGIANSAAAFGPMIGAFIGAWAVTIYVDLSSPTITPQHPAWVGAWWIIMLAVCVGLASSAPFLFFFPKRMPRKGNNSAATTDSIGQDMVMLPEREQESKRCDDITSVDNRGSGAKSVVREFLRTMWRILSNPIFFGLTLTRIPLDIIMWGYYAFLAKYVEVEFSSLSTTANIISGIAILSIGLANIASGFIITFFKLSYRRTADSMIALIAIAMVLTIALMFAGCPDVTFPEQHATEACLKHCHCDVSKVNPACDVTGDVTYLSACLAGCTDVVNDSAATSYSGCNCTSTGHVTPGLCSSCDMLPAYIVVVLFLFVSRGFSQSPLTCLIMRSVQESDRGQAMGLNILLVALLAWLPTPVLYGVVIDKSCELWQDLGGTTGYCLIYSRSRYRLNVHGFTLGVLGLELILMSLSLFFIKRRNFAWETQSEKY